MLKSKRLKLMTVLIIAFGLLLTGCGEKALVHETLEEVPTEVKTEEETTTEEAKIEEATPEATATDVASSDDAEVAEDEGAEDEDDNVQQSANGKIVVLDPGHSSVVSGNTEPIGPGSGEYKAADSSGTSGPTSGLTEYQLNLQIAQKLRTELQNRGYTVYLTREDNSTGISCAERAQMANNLNADAFIRIHADGSDSSSASGAMGICITPSNPYISSMYSESRRLSDAVLNAYVAETGFSSRGVWETDTMTGNNWSQVPCTLLEMGFMTNPNEDSLMADEAFQSKMVTGIANGVDTYFFTD
ncbi:MAG: N-acetylmuramoyl-L-alanine amidase [Eubacterium sp.]|nr:N-acetylmuramoyl-L-alanine amidase [Eubacterium sp.]